MALDASCSRCSSSVIEDAGRYVCLRHGEVAPLWRSKESDYESLAEVLAKAGSAPTYLPWPMSPGWSIADFGCVGASATVTSTSGTSDLDGTVEVTVVSEDPGVGLGARCAGASEIDPGTRIARGQPSIRVRAGGHPVPMWAVDSEDPNPLTRSVFVGEAEGRWLWLVLRPASAALLLRDEWLLADVADFGPEALEMPFGGPRPRW